MHRKIVKPEILTEEAFAPFGDVLHPGGEEPDQDLGIYRYWDKIAALEFSGDPTELGYLRVLRRPFEFERMERHRKASQTFIPLSRSTCIFALAPAGQLIDGERPDPDSIRAFILDGTRGVNLHVGTWHWSIFPVTESADYIMVVRRDTIVDDLEIVDLEAPVELRL